jgi:hypothetical protein
VRSSDVLSEVCGILPRVFCLGFRKGTSQDSVALLGFPKLSLHTLQRRRRVEVCTYWSPHAILPLTPTLTIFSLNMVIKLFFNLLATFFLATGIKLTRKLLSPSPLVTASSSQAARSVSPGGLNPPLQTPPTPLYPRPLPEFQVLWTPWALLLATWPSSQACMPTRGCFLSRNRASRWAWTGLNWEELAKWGE